MEFEFEAEVIEWRGPAPFLFLPTPAEVSAEIKAVSSRVTYGWGVIPVTARIGETDYTTSLFPKDGSYLVPVKVVVQRAEKVGVGDLVRVRLAIRFS
ncbi:MAG: hypothetical protein BGO01_07815 [Armatimonadetes bacterium 55-13]|nr:DUF1905 domain-containing protein [Armatimonadota bacterium]OJU63766.1 MAG: hypothetical protein BGO01_07815 [Armatimonadetes bacterium 55-13]